MKLWLKNSDLNLKPADLSEWQQVVDAQLCKQ